MLSLPSGSGKVNSLYYRVCMPLSDHQSAAPGWWSKVLNLDVWLELLEKNRKKKAEKQDASGKLNEKVVPLPNAM